MPQMRNNGHNADECGEAVKCEICGYTNHRTANCRRKQQRDTKTAAEGPVTCRNCGQNGHISKECKKPHATQCGNCSMKDTKRAMHKRGVLPYMPKGGTRHVQCNSGQRATIFCYNCMRYGHSRTQCKVGQGFVAKPARVATEPAPEKIQYVQVVATPTPVQTLFQAPTQGAQTEWKDRAIKAITEALKAC